jgi:dual-specificity kinase
MTQVQKFAKQLLISLDFMHTLGLTHTDLKPENILLVNSEMKWDEEKVSD